MRCTSAIRPVRPAKWRRTSSPCYCSLFVLEPVWLEKVSGMSVSQRARGRDPVISDRVRGDRSKARLSQQASTGEPDTRRGAHPGVGAAVDPELRRGRGAVSNPPARFEPTRAEAEPDG